MFAGLRLDVVADRANHKPYHFNANNPHVKYLWLPASSHRAREFAIGRNGAAAPGMVTTASRQPPTQLQLYQPQHNLFVDSKVISRQHALIEISKDAQRAACRDNGSTHGTFVTRRGKEYRLVQSQRFELRNDDVLSFGRDVVKDGKKFRASAFRVNIVEAARGNRQGPLPTAASPPSGQFVSTSALAQQTPSQQSSLPHHRNPLLKSLEENIQRRMDNLDTIFARYLGGKASTSGHFGLSDAEVLGTDDKAVPRATDSVCEASIREGNGKEHALGETDTSFPQEDSSQGVWTGLSEQPIDGAATLPLEQTSASSEISSAVNDDASHMTHEFDAQSQSATSVAGIDVKAPSCDTSEHHKQFNAGPGDPQRAMRQKFSLQADTASLGNACDSSAIEAPSLAHVQDSITLLNGPSEKSDFQAEAVLLRFVEDGGASHGPVRECKDFSSTSDASMFDQGEQGELGKEANQDRSVQPKESQQWHDSESQEDFSSESAGDEEHRTHGGQDELFSYSDEEVRDDDRYDYEDEHDDFEDKYNDYDDDDGHEEEEEYDDRDDDGDDDHEAVIHAEKLEEIELNKAQNAFAIHTETPVEENQLSNSMLTDSCSQNAAPSPGAANDSSDGVVVSRNTMSSHASDLAAGRDAADSSHGHKRSFVEMENNVAEVDSRTALPEQVSGFPTTMAQYLPFADFNKTHVTVIEACRPTAKRPRLSRVQDMALGAFAGAAATFAGLAALGASYAN